MNEKITEWNDIWHTSTLYVTEIKDENGAIYILSNPTVNEAIVINGKELKMFVKKFLESEDECLD